MNLTVVTAPLFEPVALADIYKSLRLDVEGSPATHPDDAMLAAHIRASRADIELRTRRALVQQTLRASYPGFPLSSATYDALTPAARRSAICALRLPRPPIAEVLSVQYYDASNTLVTVSAADYYVTDEDVPQILFAASFVMPTTYARPDAVRVNYVAGYAPSGSPPTTQEDYADNVPEPIKQAIILGVQCLYDDMQPADWNRIQLAIEGMVQPYRVQLT